MQVGINADNAELSPEPQAKGPAPLPQPQPVLSSPLTHRPSSTAQPVRATLPVQDPESRLMARIRAEKNMASTAAFPGAPNASGQKNSCCCPS